MPPKRTLGTVLRRLSVLGKGDPNQVVSKMLRSFPDGLRICAASGCQMKTVNSAMTAALVSTHFEGDIIVESVGKYFVRSKLIQNLHVKQLFQML